MTIPPMMLAQQRRTTLHPTSAKLQGHDPEPLMPLLLPPCACVAAQSLYATLSTSSYHRHMGCAYCGSHASGNLQKIVQNGLWEPGCQSQECQLQRSSWHSHNHGYMAAEQASGSEFGSHAQCTR